MPNSVFIYITKLKAMAQNRIANRVFKLIIYNVVKDFHIYILILADIIIYFNYKQSKL